MARGNPMVQNKLLINPATYTYIQLIFYLC